MTDIEKIINHNINDINVYLKPSEKNSLKDSFDIIFNRRNINEFIAIDIYEILKNLINIIERINIENYILEDDVFKLQSDIADLEQELFELKEG